MAKDGRTIGGYTILEEIGRGPFGPLLAARSEEGFEVVVQRCAAEDEALRRRFEREARDASRLRHRNILRVLDVGLDGDVPYVVQERIDGERVDQALKGRHGWTTLQKLGLLTQVVDGLAYAHDQGVLHRDLEPRNLLLGRDGTVRIVDFGIARLASDESQVTQKGVTYAAAAYMPPEQVRGGEVDHRADLFSLGVLAYELLAARRPFRGKTVSALVYQILYKAPAPLQSVWPEAPAVLSGIVARCLEKEPSDRYSDVHALRGELSELVAEIGAGKYPNLVAAGAGAVADLEGTLPGADDDELSRSLITRTAEEVERRRTGAAALDATIQEGESPHDAGETTRNLPPGGTSERSPERSADPPGAAVTQRIEAIPTPFDGTVDVDPTGELAQEISQLVAQGNLQQALEQLENTMGRSGAVGGDDELPTIKLPTGDVPAPPGERSDSTASADSTTSDSMATDSIATDSMATDSMATDSSASPSSFQLAPTPPPLPLPSIDAAELDRSGTAAPPPLPRRGSADASTTGAPPGPPAAPDGTGAATPGGETSWAGPSTAAGPGPAPAESSGAGSSRKLLWIAAAAAGAVGLVLALVFVVGGGDEPDEPPPAVVAQPSPPPPRAVDVEPASVLSIDARPWAEVREVTNADGFVLDLPVNATTPLLLPVDPGTYRVSLSLPGSGEPQLCEEVVVADDAQGDCVVTFDVGTADDYFKSSGWWR